MNLHFLTILLGLSFGELIAFLALLGGIVTAYTSLNVRIANIEVRQKQFETSRIETSNEIETIRKENREDHQKIFNKLDHFIESLTG